MTIGDKKEQNRIKNAKEFIRKSQAKFEDKYIYSQETIDSYVDSKHYVTIYCPLHGKQKVTPNGHITKGYGCKECAKESTRKSKLLPKEEFNKRITNKYGNQYKLIGEYTGLQKRTDFLCTKHGIFKQLPGEMLNGTTCQICGRERKREKLCTTKDKFLEMCSKTHLINYDYSLVDTTKKYVDIICKTHGKFTQSLLEHMHGANCPKCVQRHRPTTEEFTKQANLIHNGKYTYKNTVYGKNNHDEIIVTCPIHGDFPTTPKRHLIKKNGCPRCNQSHLEIEIETVLSKSNIKYISQTSRKHLQWLGLQTLDFYLPDYDIAIECQGLQHFQPIEYFGGEETHKANQLRDQMKLKKCKENGVKLLYYSNLHIDYPYHVFEDKEELLKEILKNKA